MLSVRIVTTDHYMAPPLRGLDVCISDFRNSEVKKVPVFRVFGATPAGQKTCMHIHGVFPYLYIPYNGTQPWDRYIHQFASSLDKAVNIALGSEHSNTQHVYKIALVSGIPMYGFHETEQQFLKIYLYNPNMVRRVADLLQSGAVMNNVFQPHESHIPYPLQLFIDYNLYGMNMINVAAVKFRQWSEDDNGNVQSTDGRMSSFTHPSPPNDNLDTTHPVNSHWLKTWDKNNVSKEMLLGEEIPRVSTCELEVDIVAADILNRLEVDANLGTNPGLAALWEDERQRKRDQGESSQITPPQSQERSNVQEAESHVRLKQRLEEILLEQQPYLSSQGSQESGEEEMKEDEAAGLSGLDSTPASVVHDHLSQLSESEASSQDTIILEDHQRPSEDEKLVPPIVNRDSISKVLLSSPGFDSPNNSQHEKVGDQSLVNLLAALADGGSPEASQVCQVSALEERDSVLSGVPRPISVPPCLEDEEEELEMSQKIWDTPPDMMDVGEERELAEGQAEHGEGDCDVAGVQDTWIYSQFQEEEKISQLDGPMDEKPVTDQPVMKRLGTRGPVLSRLLQSSDQRALSQGYPCYSRVPQGQQECTGTARTDGYKQRWHPTGQYEQQRPTSQSLADAQWYMSPHRGHQHDNNTDAPPEPGNYMNLTHPYRPEKFHHRGYKQPGITMATPLSPQGQKNQYLSQDRTFNQQYYSNSGAIHSTPLGQTSREAMSTSTTSISPVTNSSGNHGLNMRGSRASPMERQFQSPQHYSNVPSPQSDSIIHSSPSRQMMSPSFPAMTQAQMSPVWPDACYSDSRNSLDSQYPVHSPVSSQRFDLLSPSQQSLKLPLGKPNSIISNLLSGQVSPVDARPLYDRSVCQPLNTSRDSQEDLFADSRLIKSRPLSTSSHSSVSSRSSISGDFGTELCGGQTQATSQRSPNHWQPQLPQRQLPYPSSSVISSLENFVLKVQNDGCEPMFSPATMDRQQWVGSSQLPSPDYHTYAPAARHIRQHSAPCGQDTEASLLSSTKPQPPASMGSGGGISGLSVSTSLPPHYPAVMNNKSPPMSERGKAGRMKKLGLSLHRHNSLPADSVSKLSSTYSYSFHVPTPVYKRMKMMKKKSTDSMADISIVRMHPMDARKYSLLKIGRELVKVRLLKLVDILKIKAELKSKVPINMVISNEKKPRLPLTNVIQTHKKMSPVKKKAAKKSRVSESKPSSGTGKCFKRKSETELLLEITGPDGSTCVSRGSRKKLMPPNSGCHTMVDMKTTDIRNSTIAGCQGGDSAHLDSIPVSSLCGTSVQKCEKVQGVLSPQAPSKPGDSSVDKPTSCDGDEQRKELDAGNRLLHRGIDVSRGYPDRSWEQFSCQNSNAGSGPLNITDTFTGNTKHSVSSAIGKERNSCKTGDEMRRKEVANDCTYPPMSVYGDNLPPSMAMYAGVEPISSDEEVSNQENLYIPLSSSKPFQPPEFPSRPSLQQRSPPVGHCHVFNGNIPNVCGKPSHSNSTVPANNYNRGLSLDQSSDQGVNISSNLTDVSQTPWMANPSWHSTSAVTNDVKAGSTSESSTWAVPLECVETSDQAAKTFKCLKEVAGTGNATVDSMVRESAVEGNKVDGTQVKPSVCPPVSNPKPAKQRNKRRLSLRKKRQSKVKYSSDDGENEDVELMEEEEGYQMISWMKRRSKRSSANYGRNAFTNFLEMESEDTASDEDFKASRVKSCETRRHTRSRSGLPEDDLKEGVHYIVVGKFKGHKRMVVHVGNSNIEGAPVKVEQFLQSIKQCEICERVYSRKTFGSEMQPRSFDGISESDKTWESDCCGLMAKQSRTTGTGGADSTPNSTSNSDSNLEIDSEMKDDSSCDAVYGKNRQRSRKRALTRNQRLGVAFLTKKSKRKRAGTPNSGIIMNSLSLLHQATLANLTDIVAYTDKCDDHKTNYDDVMHKLALVSPTVSDMGDNSPPQPLSPGTDNTSKTSTVKENFIDTNVNVPEETSHAISNPSKTSKTCQYLTQTSVDSLCEMPLPSIENLGAREALKSPTGSYASSSDTDPPQLTMSHLREENSGNSVSEPKSVSDQPVKSTFVIRKDHPFLLKNTKLKIPAKYALAPSTGEGGKPTTSPPDLGPPNIPRYNTEDVKVPETQPPALYCSKVSTSEDSEKSLSESEDLDSDKPYPDMVTGKKAEEILAEKSKLKKEGFVKMLDFSRNVRLSQVVESTSVLEATNSSNQNLATDKESNYQAEQDQVKNEVHSKLIMRNHNVKKGGKKPWQKLNSKSQNGDVSQSDHRSVPQPRKPIQYLETGLSAKDLFRVTQSYQCQERPDLVSGCQNQNQCGNQAMKNASESNISSPIVTRQATSGNQFIPRAPSFTCPGGEDLSRDGLALGQEQSRKVIMTPVMRPPTWHSVEGCTGLYDVKVTEPFCSDPGDLLEKPREIGGRVLKLTSTMAHDLEEHTSKFARTGLSTWRTNVAANDPIFFSQNIDSAFVNQLKTDPQLHSAVCGDRAKAICPCNPAPSCKAVLRWMKKRQESKDNNEKIDDLNDEHSDVHKTGGTEKVNPNVLSVVQTCAKDPHLPHVNPLDDLLQKELHIPVKIPDVLDGVVSSSCPPSSALSHPGTTSTKQDSTSAHSGSQLKPPQELGGHGALKPFAESEGFEGDITLLCHNARDSLPIQSTPLKHTSGSELFSVTCTPISGSQRKVGEQGVQMRGPGHCPPKQTSLRRSLLASQLQNLATPSTSKADVSQIDGPTPKNTFGFRFSQNNAPDSKTLHEVQHLTVFSVELHVETRGDKASDPEVDPILGLFYSIRNDVPPGQGPREVTGVILVDETSACQAHTLRENEKTSKGCTSSSRSSPQPSTSKQKASPQPSTSKQKASPQSSTSKQTTSPQPSTSKQIASPQPSTSKQTASPQPSTSKQTASPQPSTSKQTTSPQPSTSKQTASPQPSTSKQTASPQPSTSKQTASPQPSTPQQTASPQPSTSKHTASQQPSTSQRKSSPQPSTSKQTSGTNRLLLQRSGISGLEVSYVKDEQALFQDFLQLIRRWDPDIIVGYEIQMLSLGYLLSRASHLGINLCTQMSRIPDAKEKSHMSAEKDEYGADHMSEIHITGRIVLNLWRIMRHEVTLNQYTFENVAFHVLHQRLPKYSHRSLTSWFSHRTHLHRWRVIDYYVSRVTANHELMEQLNLIGRTSEFARVFGIDFFSVLSRGSQYRVESMMLRLAKPLNFIPSSPSVQQRARMKAPECIPLTLEPESRFYTHPVIVLDFQSLYPSIMIAYNYCFSTCLGRLENLAKTQDGPIEFGCTSLSVSPSLLRKLKDDVTISPNGVVFVKEHIRKGIISSMVEEILNTRIMVKKEMKNYKTDKGLSRLLDARQLGLKLIANVTYGYTGANFSGRMPCVEVGDSIVRKARETLERAIQLVENTPEWRARVVYGDTDSMFLELQGRSKDEAFKIGQEIANAVTASNPKPIKLKFEKVYLPCVLQTKKRYFGYMYETPDQKEPVFDAKGVETVRRDNCPAVSKILEKCIKILFTSRDVSLIKQYVLKQCVKLFQGRVSLQDCIFAKEYRGMSGYKPGACVPALEIAKKCIRADHRSEPRVGERVPYVIVYGSPGLPLIQLVRQPMELLQDGSLRLNTTYYITKQILPPLDRFLSLIGANVFTWYQEMPRIVKIAPAISGAGENKKGTISQYFSVTNCPVCEEQTKQPLCEQCQRDPQTVLVTLNSRMRQWEKTQQLLKQVCCSCMGVGEELVSCVCLDCPMLFRLRRVERDRSRTTHLRQLLKDVF